MDFTEYIKPELLILIPVLYVIGMAVKKTALIADKLIPLVVGAIGILLSVIYVLATTALGSPQAIAMAIFTALTQGVLVGGASVYANQIFKQFKNNNTNSPQQTTNPTYHVFVYVICIGVFFISKGTCICRKNFRIIEGRTLYS